MIFIDDLSDRALNLLDKYPFVSGITTNSSILKKRGYTFLKALEILSGARGIHFIQGSLEDDRWAFELLESKLADKFIVKLVWVPGMVEKIARVLKKSGYRICATAVYTIGQGLSALEFGVDWIAVYYDRMMRNDMDPIRLIKQLLRKDAKIVVASLKSIDQVENVLGVGNVSLTLPTELFEEFVKPRFPENDLEKFEEDFRL